MNYNEMNDPNWIEKQQWTREWQQVHDQIFGTTIPATSSWTNTKDIVQVLRILYQPKIAPLIVLPAFARIEHLQGVHNSPEPKCVELELDTASMIKPMKLLFSGYQHMEWNFFWLQAGELDNYSGYNTDEYQRKQDQGEEIIEQAPGKYITPEVDSNFSSEDLIIQQAFGRRVRRYYAGGNFLFVSKASVYNTHTYLGIDFNKLGFRKFRWCIGKTMQQFKSNPD